MFVILNLPYPPPLPPCNRNRNRLAFPASAHAHRQTIVVAGNATPLSSILVLGDNTTPVGEKKITTRITVHAIDGGRAARCFHFPRMDHSRLRRKGRRFATGQEATRTSAPTLRT